MLEMIPLIKNFERQTDNNVEMNIVKLKEHKYGAFIQLLKQYKMSPII